MAYASSHKGSVEEREDRQKQGITARHPRMELRAVLKRFLSIQYFFLEKK